MTVQENCLISVQPTNLDPRTYEIHFILITQENNHQSVIDTQAFFQCLLFGVLTILELRYLIYSNATSGSYCFQQVLFTGGFVYRVMKPFIGSYLFQQLCDRAVRFLGDIAIHRTFPLSTSSVTRWFVFRAIEPIIGSVTERFVSRRRVFVSQAI